MTRDSIQDVQCNDVPFTTFLLTCCGLGLWTLLVYWNVLNCDFISYDDPLYILDRTQIPNGLTIENIRWAFTTTSDANWIPVTWLSYLLDTSIFGVSARGYHAVNLVFHLINTLLVLLVLQRFTGRFWRSAVVAALFALHPLHVESVAWIAERKDVLSGFFFLLTLLAYYSFIKSQTVVRYLVVIVTFMLGLCSKSMLVTMPFLLLFLDFWPLNRLALDSTSGIPFRRLALEKLPFLGCAFVSGLITYNVQNKAGAVVNHVISPLSDNVANALVSCVTYIFKLFIPINLSVFYPFNNFIPLWQAVVAAAFLGVAFVAIFHFRRDFPYLITGWFWFIGMIMPVIGIIRVGPQAMADRYTYLPLIGLLLIAVWGMSDFTSWQKIERIYRAGLAIICIAVLSVLTWTQVGYWHDSIALFSHAIDVTENNWLAYEHIGSAYNKRGAINKAYDYTQESIRIFPRNAIAYTNLGIINKNLRRDGDAIKCFVQAIELAPNYDIAHYHLGVNLLYNSDVGSALSEYGILKNISPERAESLMKLISQYAPMMQLNKK